MNVGQYSWAYILFPKTIRREMSYVTGWIEIAGLLCVSSVSESLISRWEAPFYSSWVRTFSNTHCRLILPGLLLGLLFLVIQTMSTIHGMQFWLHGFLQSSLPFTMSTDLGLLPLSTALHVLSYRWQPLINLVFWNLGSFVVISVVLLAVTSPKQSPKFVFTEYFNNTGWENTYCLSILYPNF